MNTEILGRPTWTQINLSNLIFNFKSVKNFIDYPIKFMAVVKADAYGHCAVECAKTLEPIGIDWFGVALPEEGLELRVSRNNKTDFMSRKFLERADRDDFTKRSDSSYLPA